MNPEVQVKNALRALADHDRDREAQTSAAAIFAQNRAVSVSKASPWRWWALVAASAVVALFLWPGRPTPVAVTVPEVQTPEVGVAVQAGKQPGEQRVEQPLLSVAAVAQKPVRRTKQLEPPHEVVTEFYPLMDAPPPFERGQLLRVIVPASTMRSVGLPVSPDRWEDRVQADVLVGEEGMARAIRFVSYER